MFLGFLHQQHESGQGSTTFREDLVLKTAAHQTVGKPKIDRGDAPSRIGWPCTVMILGSSRQTQQSMSTIMQLNPKRAVLSLCHGISGAFARRSPRLVAKFSVLFGSPLHLVFTKRRLKYIQRYQRLNSNLFFRPRPGQKIIDTMGSDENRDTAKLQASQYSAMRGKTAKQGDQLLQKWDLPIKPRS